MPRQAPSPLKSKVYIVGLGIPENRGATLEAIDVLRRCRTVFVTDPGTRFARWLCRDARSFGRLGRGRGAGDAARLCVEEMLAALPRRGALGFAIYGHPMLYEPVAGLLLEEARRRGLSVEVLGGLSAVDVTLALLGQPLLPGRGLQVGDAHYFADRRADPAASVLVYKVGMVPRRERARLAASLSSSHPPSARLAVVLRRNFGRTRDRVEWLTVGGLPARLRRPLPEYATLFLPAAS